MLLVDNHPCFIIATLVSWQQVSRTKVLFDGNFFITFPSLLPHPQATEHIWLSHVASLAEPVARDGKTLLVVLLFFETNSQEILSHRPRLLAPVFHSRVERWRLGWNEIWFTYIFMLKPGQYFYFTQGSLAIGLMFERWYFLDGDFCVCLLIKSRSKTENKEMKIYY